MSEKIILPIKNNNQVVVSAGGMDIKVVGHTITFTISQTNWEMSVGECEAMLESHQLLIDACKQIVNSTIVSVGTTTKSPVIIEDAHELRNGIINAGEALSRADVI